jgi:hypothetical protein
MKGLAVLWARLYQIGVWTLSGRKKRYAEKMERLLTSFQEIEAPALSAP